MSAYDVMGSDDISNNLLLHLSLSYDEHSSLLSIVPHLFFFEVLKFAFCEILRADFEVIRNCVALVI